MQNGLVPQSRVEQPPLSIRHSGVRRPFMRHLNLAIIVGLMFVAAASAQTPASDWQTLRTAHFRIHYPEQYEVWSRHLAGRIEAVRAAVIDAVGYVPEVTIDIVVMNPLAQANGEALTFLGSPRIVLWVENPEPESEIGNFTDWIDLVSVHEVAHVVHLARPSRSPLRHLAERLILPLGPITLAAPRWVLEGYATVIEGRVTGSGRPNGAFRAAILRRWAELGRLPAYSELDSDQHDYLGMSMAYLGGSAFLEWLETRSGPGTLRNLWARMTARQRRSFEEAFEGVFGDRPSVLYNKFTAELTASSVEAARRIEPVEGALWQETRWETGPPALSPDGSKMAIVLRAPHQPSRLVIWSTSAATEEERKWKARISRMLARDPQDVAPVHPRPFGHEPLAELALPDGGDIGWPRWLPDGRSVLFSHRQPDRDGLLHFDLFRWTPKGSTERVTRHGDVRDADPLPDGRTAVGLRSRYGLMQLVSVDLRSGAVTPLTEAALETLSHPRVGRDGKSLVYVRNRASHWQLVRIDLPATGGPSPFRAGALIGRPEVILYDAGAGIVAEPAWSRSKDEVVATVASRTAIDLVAFSGDGSESRRLTRVPGAAFAPEPAADGSVFFLATGPDGLAVRRLGAERPPIEPLTPPAVLPGADIRETDVSMWSDPYAAGRQEVSFLFGGVSTPSFSSSELGFRSGDIVGRLDVVGMASITPGGKQQGASVGAAWHGAPVSYSVRGFSVRESFSRDRAPLDLHSLDARRSGLELRLSRRHVLPLATISVAGGLVAGRIRPPSEPLVRRGLLFIDSRVSAHRQVGSARLSGAVRAAAENGATGVDRWSHALVSVRGGAALGERSFAVAYEGAGSSRSTRDLDRIILGGIQTSLVPDSADANRRFDPALPVGIAIGTRSESFRLAVRTSGPLELFYQRHQLWSEKVVPRQRIALAGAEYDAHLSDGMPLIDLPPLDFTAGIARILEGSLRGKTNWWIGLSWHP